MNLMLDSSTILAACGSSIGASSAVFDIAAGRGWTLLVTPYILSEVVHNLHRLSEPSAKRWTTLAPRLTEVDDILVIDQPVVFTAAKDRPILFSALAWADALLTLDRADFQDLLGSQFYGLIISTPGAFLRSQNIRS